MSKTFEIRLNASADDVLERIRTASAKNGVLFEGDCAGGRFSGHGVEGNYRINGGILALHITRKPLVLPWSLIESQVRGFFA